MKLTWEDLLIQDLSVEEVGALLPPWRFLLDGRVASIFLNRFGSWFLQRPEGQIDVLDVLTGTIARVAESYDAFERGVNSLAWQEEYLLSRAVFDLHAAGKVPGPRQCYALAPHPRMGGWHPARGGSPDPQRVMVMELVVWHSICRQVLGGPP
jgi:hypothetical protein